MGEAARAAGTEHEGLLCGRRGRRQSREQAERSEHRNGHNACGPTAVGHEVPGAATHRSEYR